MGHGHNQNTHKVRWTLNDFMRTQSMAVFYDSRQSNLKSSSKWPPTVHKQEGVFNKQINKNFQDQVPLEQKVRSTSHGLI